jgi:1-acyl-sn-glycerol-3-phosphate acyltransferase
VIKTMLSRFVLGFRTVLAGVWLFLSLAVLVPIAALALVVDRRQRLHDWFSIVWARGILLLMGIRVCRRGVEQISGQEHYVVVANHQGMLDIPALVAALQPCTAVRFVAKRALFHIPILGWGMRIFGHIPLDRRGTNHAMPSLLKAQAAVRERWSVIFFPEGTRTHTGEIGPFKKGAFHVAARARVRLLPVTIIGSWERLPRQKLFAISLGTICIHVHPPLQASGESPAELQVLAEECRGRIALEWSRRK